MFSEKDNKDCVGLFNHLVHPALIFSILDTGIEVGATSKIDDVLIEHGGQPNVLPLAVHLNFLLLVK